MNTSSNPETETKQRAHWFQELEKAKKRFHTFWDAGEQVIDAYRLQKSDGNEVYSKDKYNILYSSTETIKPNLYAQRPSVRIKLRNRDTQSIESKLAAKMLEGSLEYVISEEDFDDMMENVVEDVLLPGLGISWVRYEPNIGTELDENGKPFEKLLDEMVRIEYTHWRDWLCGPSRVWRTVPWVAKRLHLTRDSMEKRFGAEKARAVSYHARENSRDDSAVESETVEVWEIWCKNTKSVYWFCEQYPTDLLDIKQDPLKLKNFFPCPRPLRAITNTRTFVPRSLYSQYKSQAETLNILTKRIRLLGEALKVVGVFDGSQKELADLLNAQSGNKMIAVDSWAAFAQAGGIKGNIEWLPIDAVVRTLVELQQSREVCKNEIYEITGFSDIIRGVSKASETLGAQNIKANWAGARVRKMQREVQRFARDVIAMVGEIIAEHCDESTIVSFSGIDIPGPQQIQNDPTAMQKLQALQAAIGLMRSEAKRVSVISIETDSTIMADEEAQRKDRMDFLGAAGAFLQQAVPAMQATPELGPLLGAMLMFTVRTFPASRPIEEEFEKVQQVLETRGAQPKTDPKDSQAQAQAQTAQTVAQIKASSDQAQVQAKIQVEMQREENRHSEALAELEIRAREVAVKEREAAIKERELDIKLLDVQLRAEVQQLAQYEAEHNMEMDRDKHEHEKEKTYMQHELDRQDAQEDENEYSDAD